MKKIRVWHTRWNIVEVDEADVPGLIGLLAKTKHDFIHGGFRDILIRHGDDGGWCIDGPAKLMKYLERIRKSAGYPPSGEVFYIVIKRS